MCLKLSNALQILDDHIDKIHTVAEWAERVGCEDAKYFSRLFRNSFGIRPKDCIKLKKLERFDELIKEKPPMLHFEIAKKLGLADEAGLYKYIKRHTGESPSHWAENGGLPRSIFSPLKGIEKRIEKNLAQSYNLWVINNAHNKWLIKQETKMKKLKAIFNLLIY